MRHAPRGGLRAGQAPRHGLRDADRPRRDRRCAGALRGLRGRLRLRGADSALQGSDQAVHVLCWGITPADHDALQALSGDVEDVAGYLAEHEIARALAHPFLAGGGPEEARLRERLGAHATFLGWLDGEALPRAYASADLFCFASPTDTFGQVVLEAQASGLPVVTTAAGGPAELVQDGRSGVLCPCDAAAIGETLAGLARSPRARERLARGGLAAAASRTWERSLRRLADGWAGVLDDEEARRAA